MKALVTGASSGIGRAVARELASRGYELVITARREDRLAELADSLGVPVRVVPMDLSRPDAARRLYEAVKDDGIDLVVNNAGFGAFGPFAEIPLEWEEEMIRVNVTAVHDLFKLFLADFVRRDRGTILNVASSAAFMPGPLMATYYATKAYVYRLSLAVAEELRRAKSGVRVSVLCPGPVRTEFNDRANVVFELQSLSDEFVARYAVEKLLKGKKVIVPGWYMRVIRCCSRPMPEPLLARLAYNIQRRKYGSGRKDQAGEKP